MGIWAAALLSLGAAAPPGQPGPSIHLSPGPDGDPARASFEVRGLDPAALDALAKDRPTPEVWAALLAVFVDLDGDPTGDVPPILGTYRVEGGLLRLTPRFPLAPGVRYRARFDPSRLPGASTPRGEPITARFSVAKRAPAEAARVVRVDPVAEVVPENQLKLYIHFSAPMRRGDSYQFIHLLDREGKPLDLPFLEIGEELWDPSAKRLTVLFDPGRIKRGLKPREELGPVLEEGRRYTLVIDADWPDAEGNPLREPFRRTFAVGPPDDRPPDPKGWTVTPPTAGTSEALTIRFPEPLDRAMLDRALAVQASDGPTLAGRVEVSEDAMTWKFLPETPWRPGGYAVAIDTTLEDLAGNGIGRPFEVDAERPIERRVESEVYRLEFSVDPADARP